MAIAEEKSTPSSRIALSELKTRADAAFRNPKLAGLVLVRGFADRKIRWRARFWQNGELSKEPAAGEAEFWQAPPWHRQYPAAANNVRLEVNWPHSSVKRITRHPIGPSAAST
jgi:hypothetical protein